MSTADDPPASSDRPSSSDLPTAAGPPAPSVRRPPRQGPLSPRDAGTLLYWAFGAVNPRGGDPAQGTDFRVLTLPEAKARAAARSPTSCPRITSLLPSRESSSRVLTSSGGHILVYDHGLGKSREIEWQVKPVYVSWLIAHDRSRDELLVIAGESADQAQHLPWLLRVRGGKVVAAGPVPDPTVIRDPVRRQQTFEIARCRRPGRQCVDVNVDKGAHTSELLISEVLGQGAARLDVVSGVVRQAGWSASGDLYLLVSC